jgi:putative glycosyltransferase (TIGR04372 family)
MEIARRLARQLAFLCIWFTLLPVTLVLHFAGFRRLTVITQRIGHLAAEIDCFAKARRLGELPARRWLLLAPPGKVANRCLLEYWRAEVTTICHPLACFLIHGMSRWLLMKHDVSDYLLRLDETSTLYGINARWRNRPPILRLTGEDDEWGTRILQELGIPVGAWFACVHVREPGFSPHDDHVHAHRNSDPLLLIPAIREITRRGGWCVRVGDSSTSPLPVLERVVDYPRHPLRSERMDIVLCARARFFLGNTSGVALVSTAFGVPCALANMIPFSNLAPLPLDISIQKHLFHRSEARLLRFDEILGSPMANFRFARLYNDNGIVPVENTAEDILELVREMLDRLEGKLEETADDRALQERFMKLLRPGHYSFGTVSRIGAAYLRKYRHLLEP